MQAVMARPAAERPARWATSLPGLAGIGLTVLLLVAFVLDFVVAGTTSGKPVFDVNSIPADLARAHGSTVWQVSTWLYAFAVVPFTVFVVGLRSSLRAAGQSVLADAGCMLALVAILLHTVHNLATLAVVQFIAPHYAAGAPDAVAFEAVSRGLIGLGNAAFLPGGGVGCAVLVVGLLLLGAAQRRAGASSRVAVVAAPAAATLLTFGYLQYAAFGAVAVALAGWVAFIAWTAASSLRLLREGTHTLA